MFSPNSQPYPCLELLPLSWQRIDALRAVYRHVLLPLSGVPWITFADVPEHYSFELLLDDVMATYPNGYLIRGCSEAMAAWLGVHGCTSLRTGAEAVLNLHGEHLRRKRVQAALRRGWRHGTVHEIRLHDIHQEKLAQFQHVAQHGGKPQLHYLFREKPSLACRAFVFCAASGEWLALMTLSRRGGTSWHTELMLRHPQAPGDIMECLVAAIFETLRGEDCAEWSLGEVPIIPLLCEPQQALLPMETLLISLLSSCSHAYNFEGLYRFKNKFAPLWRPVMLCTNRPVSLLLLTELAVAMGFTDLLLHESVAQLGKWMKPF